MSGGVSARAYFSGVAVATALLVGGVMALRPGFAYSVQQFFGLAKSVPAAPDSFYTVRVAPLFEEHCGSCHGAGRQKSELRLDDYAAAMRGGKHGPVIRAGSPDDSELLARILLPPTDERAMPPQGKEPLGADDATVIRLWIAAGASPIQKADDINGAPPPVRKIEIPGFDAAAVEQARAPLAAALEDLQARYPGAIAWVARNSADLEVNASLLGQSFRDEDLAALAPLRDRIVRLDLSGTAVTDASAAALAELHHLEVLRLVNTQVTAASLAPLRAQGTRVHDGRF